MSAVNPGTVRVVVSRTDPDAPTDFTVRRIRPMLVLDALLAVQREHDPALGFRFSCRVAMCGTCTVRVDGRSVLACQTAITDDTDEISVAPVAGLPVIRDLIVDTTPFWDEWERVTPYLVPRDDLTEPARIPAGAQERRAIDPMLDCIGCAACYSGCAVASHRKDFLGPAALQRAAVLIADSRDGAREARLAAVTGEDGADRCHYAYGCTSACPKGLDPAAAIRALRRWRLHGHP